MADKGTFHKVGQYKKANKMRNDNNKYKKFVGNRAEGQGFAEKRKKKIQYEYTKMLRKEKRRGQGTQLNPSNPVDSLRRDEDELDDQEMTERNSYAKHSNRDSKMMEGGGEDTPKGDTRLGGETSIQSTNTFQHLNVQNRLQNHREFKREGRNAFSKAEFEAKKNKQEADRRREQIQKQKKEKEAALQKYKSKKRDNYFKFHCKRTRKGQPVMKYQMEFLLQKIEKQRALDKNK